MSRLARLGGVVRRIDAAVGAEVVHVVQEWDAWKQVFDDASGIHREAGERSSQVLRDVNQPNRVVHFSEWTSVVAARAFFESPRLVQIRAEAGVEAPEFLYLAEVDAGVL